MLRSRDSRAFPYVGYRAGHQNVPILIVACGSALVSARQGRAVGDSMAEYRAYIIGDDGHFIRAVDLICRDDETAINEAQQFVDGHDVELWQLDRKVGTFRHKPE
jgi:hypothetical protein